MPINLVTGKPRQGKTLWTICTVKERAEKENRQVYTCNIPNITIPGWEEIDHPDKWLDLPDGAIIIIDELQDFWPVAPQGAKVPMPILELSKHGKRGFDFYIITQDPGLVHVTPRKLTQTHYHIERIFGTQSCAVHRFQDVELLPSKAKRRGERTIWPYKKEAFNWYKSAEVHNIKREIPKKLFWIPIMIVVAIAALYMVYVGMSSALTKAKGENTATAGSTTAQGLVAVPPQLKTSSKSQPLTKQEYVSTYTPRIEGLPYTAPRYDDITKPVTAPRPAACMQMGNRCECYTQQGTKLPGVPLNLCQHIVKNGFFEDYPTDTGTAHIQQREKSPEHQDRLTKFQTEGTT